MSKSKNRYTILPEYKSKFALRLYQDKVSSYVFYAHVMTVLPEGFKITNGKERVR